MWLLVYHFTPLNDYLNYYTYIETIITYSRLILLYFNEHLIRYLATHS
jgi:hypothetical protein